MIITDIEIRACRSDTMELPGGALTQGLRAQVEFVALSFRTDTGLKADTLAFGGCSARVMATIAADVLKPFFLGRNPAFRAKAWAEFRKADRWWNHVPIYAYGPFDNGCWLLCALEARQPLYQYLGACRDEVPVYASSLLHPHPEDYAAEAGRVKAEGFRAYKPHPIGNTRDDLAIYRGCREAVGPDFPLIADPVACYTREEALLIGRELEKLGYLWFEEPLPDTDLHGLRELSRALDIPICGTEVIAGNHEAAANCLATGVVDMVRADVSWKAGITALRKIGHVAEGFGARCEIHSAIYHPLELLNLHCCAALPNCTYLEILYPLDHFAWGLCRPLPIDSGWAKLPTHPGSGIDLNWDFIDRCTYQKY